MNMAGIYRSKPVKLKATVLSTELWIKIRIVVPHLGHLLFCPLETVASSINRSQSGHAERPVTSVMGETIYLSSAVF
jgi:hypothetical protein